MLIHEPLEDLAIAQALKSAIRSLAGQVYGASSRFGRDLAGKVLILMYHRVLPPGATTATFVQPGMYVTPETFERHLRFLTAHFQMLSFEQLLSKSQDGTWDKGARYCTITFDDGWLDNYQYAYPLLRARAVPATIFLPTALIGTNRWLWSDRLSYVLHHYEGRCGPLGTSEMDRIVEGAKALKEDARGRFVDSMARTLGIVLPDERRFIDWSEAREMSRHGIAFGSHTCTHAILPRLDRTTLQHELTRPLEVLAEQQVAWVPVLAYPNGDHDDVVVKAARDAGYRAAVTTAAGAEPGRPADLLRLKRIGVHDDVTRSIPQFMFHIGRSIRLASG
jgi:peptidoglycan/xylan/chitin deacetylase (PgdA/CDA1 family)